MFGAIARRAFVKALVATLIAFCVSAGIYVTNLRYWGTDLSQSILVEYPNGALGRPTAHSHGDGRPPPTAWALIDLGPRFCAPGDDGSPSRCLPATPRTDPDRLAPLIRWVATAGPRVVVVDSSAVHSPAERGRLQAVLSAAPPQRTPVLVALPLEHANLPASAGEPAMTVNSEQARLLTPDADSTIRILPGLNREPNPISRLLTTEVRAIGAGSRSRVPTLAFAAAVVAASPPEAPFRDLDNFDDDRNRSVGRASCERLIDEECRRAFAATERVFSFPPVVPADDQDAGDEAERISRPGFLYLYLPAPRITRAVRPPDSLRDAVVVIGDSRQAAGDRTYTGIGRLSGAELHLNDIRQYLISAPVPARNLWGYLRDELPYLGIGFLVAAAVVAALAWRRRGVDRRRSKLRRFLASLVTLFVIGVLTLLAFVCYLLATVPHGPPDFMTPFVTLLLGVMIESMYRIVSAVEGHFDD